MEKSKKLLRAQKCAEEAFQDSHPAWYLAGYGTITDRQKVEINARHKKATVGVYYRRLFVFVPNTPHLEVFEYPLASAGPIPAQPLFFGKWDGDSGWIDTKLF